MLSGAQGRHRSLVLMGPQIDEAQGHQRVSLAREDIHLDAHLYRMGGAVSLQHPMCNVFQSISSQGQGPRRLKEINRRIAGEDREQRE